MKFGDKKKVNKRGQITLYIIIAVVILAAVILFFVFRTKIFPTLPAGWEENRSDLL